MVFSCETCSIGQRRLEAEGSDSWYHDGIIRQVASSVYCDNIINQEVIYEFICFGCWGMEPYLPRTNPIMETNDSSTVELVTPSIVKTLESDWPSEDEWIPHEASDNDMDYNLLPPTMDDWNIEDYSWGDWDRKAVDTEENDYFINSFQETLFVTLDTDQENAQENFSMDM